MTDYPTDRAGMREFEDGSWIFNAKGEPVRAQVDDDGLGFVAIHGHRSGDLMAFEPVDAVRLTHGLLGVTAWLNSIDPYTPEATAGDPSKAEYLGHGLYVSWDDYRVELYASNGFEKTNSILLDHYTLGVFVKYVLSRLGRDTVTAFVSHVFADLVATDDDD
jgi:hypothetical protein